MTTLQDNGNSLFGGRTAWILLVVMFTLAGGIRLYGLWKGPAEFQPVRQYHSAFLARYFWYGRHSEAPAWKRELAKATRQPIHEPPLTEWITSFGYDRLGAEEFRIPRAMASILWVLGGVAFYRILRRFFTSGASIVGTAFFLLAPFSIQQSLSFQPDSLMLTLGILTTLLILRYDEKQTTGSLVAAALVAALAILLKTQIVFYIGAVYGAIALQRIPFWQLFRDRRSWLFALVALAPGVLYVVGNLAMGEMTAQRGIIPALLLQPTFYVDWLYRLDEVVGTPALVLSLLGIALLRGRARNIGLAQWVGYVLLGLVFTYHYGTHAYYHIVAIPAAGLGLAALAEPILLALGHNSRWLAAAGTAAAAILCLAVTLVPVARGFGDAALTRRAALYAAIGEKIGHSRNVVMLARYEAFPLMYHAWIYGKLWPSVGWQSRIEAGGLEAVVEGVAGVAPDIEAVKRRFDRDFAPANPEFFVVTFMDDFKKQPALEAFLNSRFKRIAATADYVIFDLRPAPARNRS